MATLEPWTALDAGLMFVMWAVMMVAMMVPSATPMVLLYAHVLRSRAGDTEPLVPTGAFFAGYVSVWIAFSAAATTLQWALEQAALLSPMMVSTSPKFGGIVLIAAAVYQWTPAKDTCLRHCRSPIWYLSTHWRHGVGGAYVMGIQHGAYCLGCCWVLMALLFVGGVMNLLCIAAITIFVLIEKLAPFGRGVGRAGAGLLALIGLGLILGF
jgi:predicted metal-binding membrane protein